MNYDHVVPTFRLDGQLAVITGGSGGMAALLSRAMIAQGANVALLDMNLERTKVAAKEAEEWAAEFVPKSASLGPANVSAWQCDIGDADAVNECFAAVAEHHGQVATVLVNTAGYCENFPAADYPAKNAENILKVNGLGAFYVAQAFARPLIAAKKSGSCILIGSMSGSIVNDPQPQCMYNMAKAGVIHLSKSLAVEWAPHGIRVNTISPGYILTPLTKNVVAGNGDMKTHWESRIPMRRMAEPNEFVGSVLYLALATASSYTTGHDLIVDGGYTCL